jgi:hypothetical protein
MEEICGPSEQYKMVQKMPGFQDPYRIIMVYFLQIFCFGHNWLFITGGGKHDSAGFGVKWAGIKTWLYYSVAR